MFSPTALKIYAAIKEEIITSNALFWRDFNNFNQLDFFDLNTKKYERELLNCGISLTCAFDDNFPAVSVNLKSSEKPYFFAYKGNISLLNNRCQNITVVGTLNPDDNIIERERAVVKNLVRRGFNIVSGLAFGCDTVAHQECLNNGGKTIAFLPSSINKIYPKSNKNLANQIVENGGLIITEYATEPLNRYQRTGWFIARDRLQALFADKIILIASHLPKEGDSGSRHAMEKAVSYNTKRFVMYNEGTDKNNPLFGLNKRFAESGVAVLTKNEIKFF